jgi:serine phosphatase RsbU (regulator of sigma subunit)
MLQNFQNVLRSRPVFLIGGVLTAGVAAALLWVELISPLNRRLPVPSVDGKYFAYFDRLPGGTQQKSGRSDLVVATPSGSLVARHRLGPGSLIWSNADHLMVVDPQRQQATLLPNTGESFEVLTTLALLRGTQPVWSQSGTKLAYVRSRPEGAQIAAYDLLQTRSVPVPLPAGFRLQQPILLFWSPGGEELFFLNRAGQQVALEKLNAFSGELQPIAQTSAGWGGAAARLPQISPDGNRFYLPRPFNSVVDAETGQTLWKLPADAQALESPWSSDGAALFYARLGSHGKVLAHDFSSGADQTVLSGVGANGFFSRAGHSYFFRVFPAPSPSSLRGILRAWWEPQWGWRHVDVVTQVAQPMGRRELWPWDETSQGWILMSQDEYSRVQFGLYEPNARLFSPYRFPTEHEDVVVGLQSHAALLASVFLYALLGFFFYLKRPRNASTRGLFMLSLALMVFFAGLDFVRSLPSSFFPPPLSVQSAAGWPAVAGWLPLRPRAGLRAEKFFLLALGMALLPPALLHFAVSFSEGKAVTRRRQVLRGVLYVVAFLPAAALIAAGWSASFPLALRPLMTSLTLMAGGVALLFLALKLWQIYRRPSDPKVRNRVCWIVLGLAAPAAGTGLLVGAQLLWAATLGSRPEHMADTFRTGPLSLLFVLTPLLAGYALTARRLSDVHLLGLRLLRYAIWLTIIGFVYVLLAGGLSWALGNLRKPSGPVLIVSALLTAVALAPLRRWMGKWVERTFGREIYDLRERLLSFADQLPKVADRRTLRRNLDQTLRQAVQARTFWLFTLDRHSRKLRLEGGRGAPGASAEDIEFNPREPLCRYLMEKRRPFEVEVSPYDPRLIPPFQSAAERLSRLQAAVVFGLERHGELVGLMVLGNKASGEFYNAEELSLLSTIARQAAVGVENTELLAEATRESEPAAAAVPSGGSSASGPFLPPQYPQAENCQVSVQCVSAHSASASYADVIALPGKKVGLVIADVSGEGHSAPALMANLQRLLRAQAPGADHLPTLLRRINRLLASASRRSKYCTLFYAVYDPGERLLEYVNAGHHPPLLIGPGKQRFLEATGVALGMFAEVSHESRREPLEPGSAAVLYSEGVTGARNRGDEAFGVDRLVSAAQHSNGLDAAPFLQQIFEELRAFSGGRPPENDQTLLVLKIPPQPGPSA